MDHPSRFAALTRPEDAVLSPMVAVVPNQTSSACQWSQVAASRVPMDHVRLLGDIFVAPKDAKKAQVWFLPLP